MVDTGLSCYRCGYNFRLMLMGPVVKCPQCDEINNVRWAYYLSRIARALICAFLLLMPPAIMAIALAFTRPFPIPLWPDTSIVGLAAFLLLAGILAYEQSWSALLFQRVLAGFDAATTGFVILGGMLSFSMVIGLSIYSAFAILRVSNIDIWLILWVALTLGALFSIPFEKLWDNRAIRILMKADACLTLTSSLALILSIWLPGLDVYNHGFSILLAGALVAGLALTALAYGYWSKERLVSAQRVVVIALIVQGAIWTIVDYVTNIDQINIWITAGLVVFIVMVVGFVLFAIIKIKMDEKKPF